ncbi:hypothetical protein [Dolosicoccus paucivorans]|uniref:hypothetical protein n=1 Tax=Dolosicoccus paucivorans TaxID=84521 RepID=UPI000885E677|nr:hypothetical protein [Dolosicoccus paucivorans]SDI72788.1 regulator of cell morphogenesis and NO signaling [Dolosicoccus paucivorans]
MVKRNKLMEKLGFLAPVVEKVHGANHPELHEVNQLAQSLQEKYEDGKFDEATQIFQFLQRVTDYYTLPEDACEGYTELYTTLKLLDESR